MPSLLRLLGCVPPRILEKRDPRSYVDVKADMFLNKRVRVIVNSLAKSHDGFGTIQQIERAWFQFECDTQFVQCVDLGCLLLSFSGKRTKAIGKTSQYQGPFRVDVIFKSVRDGEANAFRWDIIFGSSVKSVGGCLVSVYKLVSRIDGSDTRSQVGQSGTDGGELLTDLSCPNCNNHEE